MVPARCDDVEHSECIRIVFLVGRDGLDAARAWVRETAELYTACLADARHYMSQPEWREHVRLARDALWGFGWCRGAG
jgi:hypothetical protein